MPRKRTQQPARKKRPRRGRLRAARRRRSPTGTHTQRNLPPRHRIELVISEPAGCLARGMSSLRIVTGDETGLLKAVDVKARAVASAWGGAQSRARGVSQPDQRTYNGVLYHSKAEAEKAAELDLLVRFNVIKGWARQVRIPLHVNGVVICHLVADFELRHQDGSVELIEVKGHETDVYKLKRKMFAAEYPDRKYTVVKA